MESRTLLAAHGVDSSAMDFAGVDDALPGVDVSVGWAGPHGVALNLVGANLAGANLNDSTYLDDPGVLIAAPTMVIMHVTDEGEPTPSMTQSNPLVGLAAFRSDPLLAGIDGSGYSIVIIDTGIDVNHSHFGPDANGDGIADRIVYQWDFADNDGDASDKNGHGSHVSSIALSQHSTYKGVAPGADIIALKVYKDTGAGGFNYIERALQWVVENALAYNIVSVNMSLGDSGNYSTELGRYGMGGELADLAALGVIVTASSGNDFFQKNSVQGVAYPASDPNVIAVGAVFDGNVGQVTSGGGSVAYTTGPNRITPFTQRHETLLDIFAPGAPIVAANSSGGTMTMNGTSQASPYVAGAAALAQQLAMQTIGRKLTPAEYLDLIQTTGLTIIDGDDENDNVINTGLTFKRLDIHAMGQAILAMGDPIPTLTITGTEVLEGDAGHETIAQFAVTLSAQPSAAVSVRIDTSDGTAMVSDGDYVPLVGHVITFNPGDPLTQLVNVIVSGDARFEPDEHFNLVLSEPVGAVLEVSTAQVTILNDDLQAPQVTQVLVGSTAWTQAFSDHLETQGLGGSAFIIGSGLAQLATLPWTGINVVQVRFTEAVTVGIEHLSLVGVGGDGPGAVAFHYDATTFTATWTLAAPLTADKWLVVVDDAVTNTLGQPLDGEWTTGQTPASGDDVAGGDFLFRINVLPGDVDGDGGVTELDMTLVRGNQFKQAGSAGYDVRQDINGSGDIFSSDVILVRNRQGTTLPEGEPDEPGVITGLGPTSETGEGGATGGDDAGGDATVPGPVVSEPLNLLAIAGALWSASNPAMAKVPAAAATARVTLPAIEINWRAVQETGFLSRLVAIGTGEGATRFKSSLSPALSPSADKSFR